MSKKRLAVLLLCMFAFFLTASVTAYAGMEETLQQLENMNELGKSGKYQECIQAADQILKNDKSMMEAYGCKSTAYIKMGKTEEALEVLIQQLKLNPKNKIALYNAACSCALLGKKDQAIEYLKQLISIDINQKKEVIKDTDLNAIKQTEEFKSLTGISVRVGGEMLYSDVPPLIKDGRTMLPMRSIFEALGARITWDGKTKTVTAVKGSTTINAAIDKKAATVNGVNKELDVPVILYNGRTLVPVRFISEALGAAVNWDSDNQHVEILTGAPEGSGTDYDNVKKQLDSLTAVSVVDGMWPQPYSLEATEGVTLIIAKDKKALDLMNSLDSASREKYMNEVTQDNFGLVVGCEVVHVKFVYDGKVYYSGDMYSDKEDEGIELAYFEKGLPVNVVKQFKMSFNYKDFYLLPEAEQVTSAEGD